MFQCLRTTLLIFGGDRLMLILAEFLFLLRWCCLFLLKVFYCPFLLLLLYVYLLAAVGNIPDKPLSELLTIEIEFIRCSADPFESKRLTIRNTVF